VEASHGEKASLRGGMEESRGGGPAKENGGGGPSQSAACRATSIVGQSVACRGTAHGHGPQVPWIAACARSRVAMRGHSSAVKKRPKITFFRARTFDLVRGNHEA